MLKRSTFRYLRLHYGDDGGGVNDLEISRENFSGQALYPAAQENLKKAVQSTRSAKISSTRVPGNPADRSHCKRDCNAPTISTFAILSSLSLISRCPEALRSSRRRAPRDRKSATGLQLPGFVGNCHRQSRTNAHPVFCAFDPNAVSSPSVHPVLLSRRREATRWGSFRFVDQLIWSCLL
jgi:hypothetical protein